MKKETVTLKEIFYQNGNVLAQIPGFETKDGFIKHGIELQYFEDGKTIWKGAQWNNGVKDGVETEYYRAGGVGREKTWCQGECTEDVIHPFVAPVN